MVRQQLAQLVIVGLLATSWLLAESDPALACSCASNIIAREEIVFVGRVVAVVEGEWIRERLRQIDYGHGSTVGLLSVKQMARGPARPFFTVIGGTGQGDCKLHFVAGAPYLIHTGIEGYGPLDASICGGSWATADNARSSRSREGVQVFVHRGDDPESDLDEEGE